MGQWRRRANGKAYYYRTVWRGGRAVTEYADGPGGLGRVFARLDEVDRLEKARDRAALREAEEADRDLDAAVTPVHAAADALVGAFMAWAGFGRTKRGPWRRRRVLGSNGAENVRKLPDYEPVWP